VLLGILALGLPMDFLVGVESDGEEEEEEVGAVESGVMA